MLLTIGEQKVNSLDSSGVMEVEVAKASLQDASRDIQSDGWHFNTDRSVRLMPDRDGHIDLPANCLRADSVGRSFCIDVVQRGTRLYNRRTNSYLFTTPVTLDLVTMLDWEELPQFARKYITIVGARRFQERVAASQVIEQFTQRDELMARIVMESADAENADYNIIYDTYPNIRSALRRW